MNRFDPEFIRNQVADDDLIYKRGERLFEYGACVCTVLDMEDKTFEYAVDGNYGDYTINIQLDGDTLKANCDCPYPGPGCKHTVAALLDICQNLKFNQHPSREADFTDKTGTSFLTHEEIRQQAIEDRKKKGGQ